MKRRKFIQTSSLLASAAVLPFSGSALHAAPKVNKPTIFITGGGTPDSLMKYFFGLTGKERPKALLLPTASADSAVGIKSWYDRAEALNYEPYSQRMFISSYRQEKDFESILLDMDAIWVSGGNTLNMIAIWKAQGIDKILKKAWDKGIVLGGGSAGSICWFEGGVTDSRPIELTSMDALGFLPGSHCPHYSSEGPRQASYRSMIKDGRLKPGYALDNNIGLHFEGTQLKKVVADSENSKGYFVSMKGGKVVEEPLKAEVLRG